VAELNITGTFDWVPTLNLTQEIAQLVKGQWEPGTTDFAAVAGTSVACQTFGDMLGVILAQPPGTVGRVNVFTHGERARIAFSGEIIPRMTIVDVMMRVNSGPGLVSLDALALDNLKTPGLWFQVGTDPKQHTLADVRARFTANAIIFFYSCHSGGDRQLLQDVADTLGVMVDGFRPAIAYCPKFSQRPPWIDRKHIGLGACNVFQADTFYHLAPTAANREWIISCHPRGKPRP
jgi:hypothetical protein